MNERMTKRDIDGRAVMDCKKCKADWMGKHGKPMVDCTALYCRNRLKDRLAAYEDTGLTPEQFPAADVEPVRHGAWYPCFEDWRQQQEGNKCSVCGFEYYGTGIRSFHYCPNCGAKMDLI